MNAAPANPEALPRPIASAAEAEQVVAHLAEVMEALVAAVENETELVRAGKLAEAVKLEPYKTELSRLYIAGTSRIKASQGYLRKIAPAMVADLHRRHDLFRALLQMNLTVLATAHAVSESIMRGVSAELSRKATPQGYGASGAAMTPPASSRQPLTVSRVL